MFVKIKILGIPIFSMEIIKRTEEKSCSDRYLDKKNEEKKDGQVLQRTDKPNAIYTGKARPNLKELEIELGYAKAPVQEIITKCVSCKGKTYESDITVCNECGSYICSGCGNVDMQTGKKYCEKCWKEV